MLWVAISIAAICFIVFLFVRTPARSALGLSFAAQHACERRDWATADRFCRQAMAAAGSLKEPVKTQIETQIAAQWATVFAARNKTNEGVYRSATFHHS
jgi:hypothetical protein